MSQDANEIYGFGPYRISSAERVLRRGEEIVPLTPKCADTLLALARNAGKVVDKETLMRAVWPDDFVEEGNLAQNIFTLRKILGKTPDGARYIQTVPKRGYLLVKPADSTPAPVAVAAEPAPGPAAGVWKRRAALSVTAALACALAAAGWTALSTAARAPEIRIVPLTVPNNVLYGTLSPNASQIAYVSRDADGDSLWIRPTAELDSGRRIAGPLFGGFWGVTFAPSGDSIYYTFEDRRHPEHGVLYRIAAGGGPATRVLSGIAGAPSFSPDGRRLAFKRYEPNDRGYLLTAAVSGGQPQLIASSRASYSYYTFRWDDGRNIEYVEGNRQANGNVWSVQEVGAATGGGRPSTIIPAQSKPLRSTVWLNRSEILAVVPDQDAAPSQIWRLSATAPPQRLTAGLNDYTLLSASADCRTVLATSQETQDSIWTMPASGGDAAPLALPPGSYNDPAWTPDGRVVYIGPSNIWVASPDGRERRPLLSTAVNATDPVVSPDGRFLVFVRHREGAANLWKLDLEGGGMRQLTYGRLDRDPSLSPDGRWVIYTSDVEGRWGISKAAIDAPAQAVRLADTYVEPSAIAPDGARFAFSDTAGAIQIRSFADGALLSTIPAPADASDLTWTPNGSAIVYVSRTADGMQVWRQPVSGGPRAKPTKLALQLPLDTRRVRWTPGAGRIVYLRRVLKVDLALISNFR